MDELGGGRSEGISGSEVLAEFEALYLENGMLRGELAAICEEFEHTNRVVIPSTQTSYLIKVGALRVELLQQQIRVMKIRRRIVLLREVLERGETVREEAVKHQLKREFREWDNRLRVEVSQIEEAKSRFSSLAAVEDVEEIRSVYRILSRKLNPEINPDQSEEAKSFWPSVHSAYVWGDLFQLKALLMMAEDYPESYDLPSNIGAMRIARGALKEKIASMRRQLDNAREHPAFEWRRLLDDPEALAAEQRKLRDEIEHARLQRTALTDMLKSLELRGIKH